MQKNAILLVKFATLIIFQKGNRTPQFATNGGVYVYQTKSLNKHHHQGKIKIQKENKSNTNRRTQISQNEYNL